MKPTELKDSNRSEIDYFISQCGALGISATATQIVGRYLMFTEEQRIAAHNALVTLTEINFSRALTEAEQANLIVEPPAR